jgi:DNA topoisomerase-3
MKKLIIAEKEAVAKAIVEYFKSENIKVEQEGKSFKTDLYYVTWASGHLLKLKTPEDINSKYEKWVLEDLPIYADNWGKKPIDRNKFLLDTIEKLLKKSDIEEIINAGDPDDEGQYLIDEILEYFNNKKPVKRLLINDPTIGGVKNSFNNIKDNKEYEPLGRSAAARAVSDNLLGINLSRYFTLKNKVGTLSIGRVQTPTLAMIVNRDNAIKNHVKEKYYEFFANMQVIKNDENLKEIDNLRDIVNKNFCDKNLINEYLNNLENNYKNLEDKHIYRFKYILPSSKAEEFPDKKIKNKSYFEEIDKKLQEQNMKITVTKQFLKENPPLPFNLMKLQVYCSNKFNYSPDDVMKITQNLRDSYNAITYNRSDCEYLSEEQYKESVNTIPIVLKNLNIQVPEVNYDIKSKAFEDSKITAHTAIIPTQIEVDLNKLTEQERNVYKAIADYYIIQFLQNALKEKTEATLTVIDEKDFKITSEKYVELGYRAYLKEKTEETTGSIDLLPGIYESKYINNNIEEKETKPLKKYTEGTILSDMVSISKYIEDPEIRAILREKDKDTGEKGSIGTPATRSLVLSILYKRGYIEKQGKNVVSTDLGKQLISILPKELISAEMTANWWLIQEKIKNNETTEQELINDVLELVKRIISSSEQKKIEREDTREVIGTCPLCKGNIYQGKTKTGKVNYYCENYKTGCNFTLWEEMKYFDNTLKITKTRAKNLIAGKKVSFKLIGKNKKEYEGYLKLKISDYNNKKYINFENAGYVDNKK